MRLPANENFPRMAVEALRAEGHDVAWIRIDAPGISDEEVIARAVREDRILLTLDKTSAPWRSERGYQRRRG